MVQESIKVVVIVGATGIGKTAISLECARRLNTEIINADASQFRKDINIGTAKLDLATTPIKHHLIDIIAPTDEYSIMDYQRDCRNVIADIANRQMIPLIVGGSGLYVNAAIYDYHLQQSSKNPNLLSKYDDFDNVELHDVLKQLDEDTAKTIHPNNRKRVLRAIERSLVGDKISENICDTTSIYETLIICLNTDREVLYQRINARVEEMINNGWIEECIALENSGIDVSKLKDIGYKEIAAYLKNDPTDESLHETIELIKQKTRNYAKRQITWFNNKMKTVKVEVDYQNIDNTTQVIMKLINDFNNNIQ